MKKDKIIVYSPDRLIKIGFLNLWKEMFSSLFQSRELIWRLFLRDFSAKYRQSLLGVLWAIINPIITVGVFIFLNRAGILNIGETSVPYPVFALIGISIYGIFSTGLSASSNCIIGAGPMVVKINFPKISLVIAAVGQSIVEFLVRLVLIMVIFIIFGVVPKWTAIFLPFTLLPVVLITLGIGFILSLLGGIFRDIVYGVPLLTTLLLFLVPALYPAPSSGMLATLNKWNPLSHLVTGCRDLLISGALSNPSGFLVASILSIIIFLVSWRIFFLSESRIAERV
ncbi:MAG: ABC transporter permease [Ignavibacteriae bacterium]|nr:ABC transporter permease [Ignavibacteriota bacterium]